MPEVFADYPQRHLLATSWALCFRKIYVYHIIIFVRLRSNYECKDTYFFCFSQIFFYLSQSVCEIFPCQCNHSIARCSSILRLSLSAAVIFQQKSYWIKKRKINEAGGGRKKPLQQLSEERRNFIQNSLDQWCMDLGYKDCNVNMLTLSRTLCISKNELSQFFDQCLHSNFRIWLSEIRLNAAKKMMLEYPDYSNDIISAECGFSCRTHLYRIFKTKEGCSPTEWRGSRHTDVAQNVSL